MGIQSQRGERELEKTKQNTLSAAELCVGHTCSLSLDGSRGGGSEKENSDSLGDSGTRVPGGGLHCRW